MGINKGHQLIEWRNKLELNQLEMSRLLGIIQYKLNAYETNEELATEMIMNDFGLKVSELQDPTPNQCKKAGGVIRKYRETYGISQGTAGEYFGLNPIAVSKVERGIQTVDHEEYKRILRKSLTDYVAPERQDTMLVTTLKEFMAHHNMNQREAATALNCALSTFGNIINYAYQPSQSMEQKLLDRVKNYNPLEVKTEEPAVTPVTAPDTPRQLETNSLAFALHAMINSVTATIPAIETLGVKVVDAGDGMYVFSDGKRTSAPKDVASVLMAIKKVQDMVGQMLIEEAC